MKWKKNLGKGMRAERLSWGMSRNRLAKLSHVDKEFIEDLENGIITNPDFYKMLNICDILETSVYFYLKKEGEINNA